MRATLPPPPGESRGDFFWVGTGWEVSHTGSNPEAFLAVEDADLVVFVRFDCRGRGRRPTFIPVPEEGIGVPPWSTHYEDRGKRSNLAALQRGERYVAHVDEDVALVEVGSDGSVAVTVIGPAVE